MRETKKVFPSILDKKKVPAFENAFTRSKDASTVSDSPCHVY